MRVLWYTYTYESPKTECTYINPDTLFEVDDIYNWPISKSWMLIA